MTLYIYIYKFSESVGWSNRIMFKTPPAGGSGELKFLAFGDMGKAPRDKAVEHYIQVFIHEFICNVMYKKLKYKMYAHVYIIYSQDQSLW